MPKKEDINKKKKTNIKNLIIKEVSHVSMGANQAADVLLFKGFKQDFKNRVNINEDFKKDFSSLKTGEQPMNLEELKKALEEQKAETELVKSQNAELLEQVEKSQKELESANSEIEKMKEGDDKKKKEDAAKEKEMEDKFKKGLDSETAARIEAIEKKAAENEEIAKKLQEENDLMKLEKSAEEQFPHLPGAPIQKALLLKTLNSMSEDQQKYMTEVLKSADTALSVKFEEIGKAGTVQPGQEELDTLVKSYQSEHNVDETEAMNQVLKTARGKELYGKLNSTAK